MDEQCNNKYLPIYVIKSSILNHEINFVIFTLVVQILCTFYVETVEFLRLLLRCSNNCMYVYIAF
jgi:hypothetical protein